jgi:hypothetical protein
MDFPLYTSLYQEAIAYPEIPIEEFPAICSTINAMPREHADLIYALILHYLHQHDSGSIPRVGRGAYNSKLMGSGKGLTFTVEHLPQLLRKIIYLYVKRATS